MKTIDVPFKKVHKDAILPSYAHGPEEDAGMDLYALEPKTLHIGQQEVVRTGVSLELPPGVEAQVRSRGGLAARHGITVLTGTVDPAYRGEVFVVLIKLSGAEPYEIKAGDRIAQLVINEYVGANVKQAKKLSETNRGDGAFGSTGR